MILDVVAEPGILLAVARQHGNESALLVSDVVEVGAGASNLSPATRTLQTAIAQCKAEIGEIDIVLRGTLTERYMPCGRKGCRCQARLAKLHGPYFQWTTKVDGKTKTVRLRHDEVPFNQEWIANGRNLDQIIKAWEQIGHTAAQLIREK